MSDTSAIKARLEAQRDELERRLLTLNGALTEPLDPDSSERAVEVEDDASVEAQARLVEREIASVTRALGRIADGSYGTCARCGCEIASARLLARPEAALCIHCARLEH